jgi:hypothetical protein
MNRIGILDGYGDYGAHKGKRRGRRGKVSHSKKAIAARKRFKKAAKSCARRSFSGSYQNCMKKKLKKKGRR